jgi:hypothetical protein
MPGHKETKVMEFVSPKAGSGIRSYTDTAAIDIARYHNEYLWFNEL